MKDVPSGCSDWWIHWTRCVAACVLCAMMLSCGGLEKKDRVDRLEYTLQQYGAALRWGRYNEAADLRQLRGSRPKEVDFDSLENIRVTSYVIKERLVTADQTEAVVTVEIDFYQEDLVVIQKIEDKQVWWYEEERRRWWLDGELPDFK